MMTISLCNGFLGCERLELVRGLNEIQLYNISLGMAHGLQLMVFSS